MSSPWISISTGAHKAALENAFNQRANDYWNIDVDFKTIAFWSLLSGRSVTVQLSERNNSAFVLFVLKKKKKWGGGGTGDLGYKKLELSLTA